MTLKNSNVLFHVSLYFSLLAHSSRHKKFREQSLVLKSTMYDDPYDSSNDGTESLLPEDEPAFENMRGEILLEIFSYLNYMDLLNVSITCRRFNPYAYRVLCSNLAFYHCYSNQIPQMQSNIPCYDYSAWPHFRHPSIHIQPDTVVPENLGPSSVLHPASIPYCMLDANKLDRWSYRNWMYSMPHHVRTLDFIPHQLRGEEHDLPYAGVGYYIATNLINPAYMDKLNEITIRAELDDICDANKVMRENYKAFYMDFFCCLAVALHKYSTPVDIRILTCYPMRMPYALGNWITHVVWQTTSEFRNMVGVLWLASQISHVRTLIISAGGCPIDPSGLPNIASEVIIHQLPFTFGRLLYLSTLDYMLPLQLELSWLPKSLTHLQVMNIPGFFWEHDPMSTGRNLIKLSLEIKQLEIPRKLVMISFETLLSLEINCALFKRADPDVSEIVMSIVAVNHGLIYLHVPRLTTKALAFALLNSPKLRFLHVLLEFVEEKLGICGKCPPLMPCLSCARQLPLTEAFGLLSKCPDLVAVYLTTFTGQISAQDMFEVVQACKSLDNLVLHQIHDVRAFPFDFEKYFATDSRVGCLKDFDPISRSQARVPSSLKGKRRKRFLFDDEPPVRKAFIEERGRSLVGGRYEFFATFGCLPEQYSEFYRVEPSYSFTIEDIPVEAPRVGRSMNAFGISSMSSIASTSPTQSSQSSGNSASAVDRGFGSRGSLEVENHRPGLEPPNCEWPVVPELRPEYIGFQSEEWLSVLYEKPSTRFLNYQKEYYPWPNTYWFQEMEHCKESYFESEPDLNKISRISPRRIRDIVYDRFLDPQCHNNVLVANIPKLRAGAVEHQIQKAKEEKKARQERNSEIQRAAAQKLQEAKTRTPKHRRPGVHRSGSPQFRNKSLKKT